LALYCRPCAFNRTQHQPVFPARAFGLLEDERFEGSVIVRGDGFVTAPAGRSAAKLFFNTSIKLN
jgi:hypothetical protein